MCIFASLNYFFIRKILQMFEQDKRTREEVVLDVEAIPHISRRQKAVLAVFVIGISVMVGGIILKGFNIDELSAVFLAIGIIGGVAGGLGAGELCDHFLKGCGNMLLSSTPHLLESLKATGWGFCCASCLGTKLPLLKGAFPWCVFYSNVI